uniref:putative ankyrin repeat domain-containing protein 19 n=1 Tax=Jaculus jaculus TaxID=51337 RepID=UPI001E1B0681|nr:putative ankyrin repeat domain-containing protein 19 [Jaculus jaculus]
MKKIFGNRSVKKTPLGFCDGQQRTLVGFFVDPQKRQPRYHHTYKPVGKVHRAAASGEMDVAQLQVMVTLEEGLVNDRDYKGRTPLHFACAYGCDSAVAFLVERNCEIDACDNNNITPLMKAVQCYKRKCARILLDHQADTNIKDNCGNTALHFAIYNSDAQMTELLLQHNADIEQKTQEGLTPLLLALRENSTKVAALLINTGANIKAADEYERNALMYAVRCNSLDLFELLIEKGIDFFYKDIFDWTALRYAVEGHCTFKSTILDHQEKYFKRNAAPCSKKHSKDNSIARPFKNHISRTTWHASKKNEQHFQTKNVYESSDTKFVGDSSGTPESRDNCRKHDTEEGNIRNEEEDMNTETLNETVPLLKFDTEAKESVLKEPGEEELPLIMSGIIDICPPPHIHTDDITRRNLPIRENM